MAQSTGETGTEGKVTGTDDNGTHKGGVGPYSDEDDGLSGFGHEESEDVAVEFGEDPIEQTRKNRRTNYRPIPDRARLEDLREQAMNNFMLSPWVVPSPFEEESKEDANPGPTVASS